MGSFIICQYFQIKTNNFLTNFYWVYELFRYLSFFVGINWHLDIHTYLIAQTEFHLMKYDSLKMSFLFKKNNSHCFNLARTFLLSSSDSFLWPGGQSGSGFFLSSSSAFFFQSSFLFTKLNSMFYIKASWHHTTYHQRAKH